MDRAWKSRWPRHRIYRSLLLVLPAGLIGILIVWPIAMLFLAVFRKTPPGTAAASGFDAVTQTLSTPGTAAAILNSVILALVTTAAGTLIATLFAFLSARTDAPFRRLISATMLIMFATPPLFYALGYSLLANKYNGLLNALLHWTLGPSVTVNVESWPGLLLVGTFRATAFIYLFLIGPVRALDQAHADASLISGVGRLGTVLRIDIPMLTPALTGAAILGLVAGLHIFDTALIIGEPAGIRVASTQIYDFLTSSFPPEYGKASFLAVLLVGVVGILCLLQARLLGKRSFVTVTGKSGHRRVYRLGRWRKLAGGFILGYVAIAQILPVTALVVASVQPFPGVYGKVTLSHYLRVFSTPATVDAIGTTLVLAVFVGALAMTLATVLSQLNRVIGRRAATVLRFTTLMPQAMPGIVAALAVTWAYVSVPGLRQLYGTIWLLMLALIVVVMPFAMQTAQAASAQLAPELQEAARTAGAPAHRALFDIVFRLIAPSFFSGWYVAAVAIAGNLDVPLLLGSPGLTTVAAEVFVLNAQSKYADAAALLIGLVLVMTAVAAVGFGVAAAVRRRHEAARASRSRDERSGWAIPATPGRPVRATGFVLSKGRVRS